MEIASFLPDLPCDVEGPVFAEPWQAQAFAMSVALHKAGLFSWTEWADALSQEIKRAQADGDPDHGDTYYDHWLNALEKLIVAKGVADRDTLEALCHAWDRAADATPHGQPILLENDPKREFA